MAESPPAHVFVVPAYGDSPFLSDCLMSLQSQRAAGKVILTTSTPSPFIERIARQFDAELIVNPQASGIASDWNFALTATDARRVTLAHQDDVYYPAFLERSVELLEGSPQAVLSFTGYQEIDDAGLPVASRISRAKHFLEALTLGGGRRVSRGRLRAFLSFGNPLPCSSVTFDRNRLGDFAFSTDFRSNLDWDAWLRLLERGDTFARTPERLIGRRHNALTATARLIGQGRRQAEDLTMFRRLWPWPIADALALFYRAGYRVGP